MCYNYTRDFPAIVAYLCDGRCASNRIRVSSIYTPGTAVHSEYTFARNRVTRCPTMTLRQTLLQLSWNPTQAKARQYEAIVRNWAFKTLLTDPTADDAPRQRQPLTDEVLEFYNCVCVVAMSFLQIRAFLAPDAAALMMRWIAALDGVVDPGACRFQNNIAVTGYVAKIACAVVLGAPAAELDALRRALDDFVGRTVTADGFVRSEDRQNATIVYHGRFALMVLMALCLLSAGATGRPSSPNRLRTQTRMRSVLDRLGSVVGTADVPPPSFFHARTRAPKWTAPMRPIAESELAALTQMFDYAFVDRDAAKLRDTKWFWSSLTFGDLGKVLLAVVAAASSGPTPPLPTRP
jgi:hypothetical protein